MAGRRCAFQLYSRRRHHAKVSRYVHSYPKAQLLHRLNAQYGQVRVEFTRFRSF
jgi:hypothetical protein